MIKLYTHPLSGNAHRAELTLRALNVPFEAIVVDLANKAQKQPEFLALNPFGQVPVLDDNGTVIWDSVAIMTYLGLTYDDGTLLPRDPALFAQVTAWLAKTAGPIAYGLGAARRANIFRTGQDLEPLIRTGREFLDTIENLLSTREWLVGGHLTLADIGCYAYIAAAPEGGVDLAPYPHVTAWLNRIEAQAWFTPLAPVAVGLRAAVSA